MTDSHIPDPNETGSKSFDELSMNGKHHLRLAASVRPERRRRAPRCVARNLVKIVSKRGV